MEQRCLTHCQCRKATTTKRNPHQWCLGKTLEWTLGPPRTTMRCNYLSVSVQQFCMSTVTIVCYGRAMASSENRLEMFGSAFNHEIDRLFHSRHSVACFTANSMNLERLSLHDWTTSSIPAQRRYFSVGVYRGS